MLTTLYHSRLFPPVGDYEFGFASLAQPVYDGSFQGYKYALPNSTAATAQSAKSAEL
jgi:hypothetical protein